MTILVQYTASVLNPDTGDTFNGWVDPAWSRYELRSTEEDVRTFEYETLAEALADVESTVGPYDSWDGESYYAADEDMNPESGEIWMYAAHFAEA
jgi:hypothetical protein